MSHVHSIVDEDRFFVIDPVSRAISNKSDKVLISQYDHDSERFTFKIPRYVEDHDMSLCDRIEVHFTNITRNKKEQNDGVYIVQDVSSDRDTVFFSWLISNNATQLIGSLKFSITFLCFDDTGYSTYNWGTDIFDSIQVIARLDNTETVIEKYPDLIEQMKQDILDEVSSSGPAIDEAEVERIIGEYLAANSPASGENGKDGTDGISPTVSVEAIDDGHRITITDVNGSQSFDILNGTDGEPGSTPVKGVDYYTETEKEELIQEILSRLITSDDLKQVIAEVVGETETIDDTVVTLLLGGEDDESLVAAEIDDTEYPVLNTEDPVQGEDEDSYTIEVTQNT